MHLLLFCVLKVGQREPNGKMLLDLHPLPLLMTVFRLPQPSLHVFGLWIVVTSPMQLKWQLNYTSENYFYIESFLTFHE